MTGIEAAVYTNRDDKRLASRFKTGQQVWNANTGETVVQTFKLDQSLINVVGVFTARVRRHCHLAVTSLHMHLSIDESTLSPSSCPTPCECFMG